MTRRYTLGNTRPFHDLKCKGKMLEVRVNAMSNNTARLHVHYRSSRTNVEPMKIACWMSRLSLTSHRLKSRHRKRWMQVHQRRCGVIQSRGRTTAR